MRAVLEFNLPEDRNEFVLATNGSKYFYCLDEMRRVFRDMLKYEKLTKEEYKKVEELQQHFFYILSDNNVGLEEIE